MAIKKDQPINVKTPSLHVIHLSAECFPVAKVGGLADVVGALPKYLEKAGVRASVIMPWYNKPFVQKNEFELVFSIDFFQGSRPLRAEILKEKEDKLGFELYLIKIPGLLDRTEVYSYQDEGEQFMAFQHAVLLWLNTWDDKPDLVHCHDHHTGLVPFLMYHCDRFAGLHDIPTVATVHNGQYQGWMDWHQAILLPAFDTWKWGLLDWNKVINPLAALIKCCTVYTTVSEGYLQELSVQSNGLEHLFDMEQGKAYGIVNGIDGEVWDPETDPDLFANYGVEGLARGKASNKKGLCKQFGLDDSLPLIAYIGRFAFEKGADLLPDIIETLFADPTPRLNLLVLGSGDKALETRMYELAKKYPERLGVYIGYQEALAHQIYAATDFLIMPSRVEPCGLNQLYAMRYGTVPVVSHIGGLRDTVVDCDTEGGYGITFPKTNVTEVVAAIHRALVLYAAPTRFESIRAELLKLDFSWYKSAVRYIELYQKIILKS